jgi:hypothetical protein
VFNEDFSAHQFRNTWLPEVADVQRPLLVPFLTPVTSFIADCCLRRTVKDRYKLHRKFTALKAYLHIYTFITPSITKLYPPIRHVRTPLHFRSSMELNYTINTLTRLLYTHAREHTKARAPSMKYHTARTSTITNIITRRNSQVISEKFKICQCSKCTWVTSLYNNNHHLPPRIRSFDLFRHRRVVIFS